MGEAQKQYAMVNTLKERIEEVRDYINWNNYEPAIELLNDLLEYIPWDPSLRELRSECYLGMGNVIHAISDIRTVTKLTTDNTAASFKLSNLHYQIGEAEESLIEIRECLKLDPEHKDCYPFYKKLKKVAKYLNKAKESREQKEWNECVENAQKVLSNEPTVEGIRFHAYDRLCHCQKEAGNAAESRKACGEAIKIEPDEPRLYCDRAEAYLLEDMFDEAINEFRTALEKDESFSRAKEGMAKAQKLQKQAGKRDYYKILGVKRSATKKEIQKAYKKLALEWHPDKFQDEEEKKAAEKKFMDIAAAKEVLTDADMRAKYDAGEDPLDPEGGGGGD